MTGSHASGGSEESGQGYEAPGARYPRSHSVPLLMTYGTSTSLILGGHDEADLAAREGAPKTQPSLVLKLRWKATDASEEHR